MAEDNELWVVMESAQIEVTNTLQANESIKTELYDSGASRHMSPFWDALHAPEMGLTVVSVGCITNAGYSVAFEGNTCKIKNQSRTLIGSIPSTTNNLYKVEQVNVAITMPEQVNLYTLHHQLGHITPNSICKLVKSNVITGIQLIDEGPKFTCLSCEYAGGHTKANQKGMHCTACRCIRR